MLENRYTTSDSKSRDDRKVVLYGDLDRPLDENTDGNSSNYRIRTRSNNTRYFNNLIRKPPVPGKFGV